ncbi:cyclic nucleotide-binding domain-containing protein [Antarcticimicrobium luteum]|uniref:Cyclic nucleotide-binding domain-containing protein n=1 Tax=Antarcticimicrobium luteum TaxID=2547397 RepID=A0A4R5VE94_9RHOB|nr:cyclic nucleotide-binding domain-containing protein [Antarcticimicrobium luteum]TDK50661.1 cyclic nucleotide-binding domain-containing protein [Antarcticimicrobium luteum]
MNRRQERSGQRAGSSGNEEAERIFARLLPHLDPETLDLLSEVAHEVRTPPGMEVVTQGARDTPFYVICEGSFGVFRTNDGGDADFRVAVLGEGEPFGEMAILDPEPRSASVRAETEGRVLEIRPDEILERQDGDRHLSALRGALAIFVTRRMRASTNSHVATLQRELALKSEQKQFGLFFVYSLIMMSIGTLVNNAIARTLLDVDIYTAMFAWQYLAILMIPSYIVIRHMNISVQSLGLTTVGLKRSLKEGAVIAVALCLFAYGLGEVLKMFDALPGQPVPFELFGTISYFLHSALQEMIARGFLQSSFQRFLGDGSGWQSVVLASILFGMFHLHFGLVAVVMTILTGFAFGALYARHQNLAGVTLVHFMMGVAAFSVGLI